MRTSKYAEEFDRMKDLLIRLATEKDENGHLKYNTPELMKLAGFGSDPKVIDAFNRWLNRHGIYRKPRAKKETPAPQEETAPQELFPDTPERDPVTAMLADCGKLNEIARALNRISEGMQAIAEAVGLHILIETVHTTDTGTANE